MIECLLLLRAQVWFLAHTWLLITTCGFGFQGPNTLFSLACPTYTHMSTTTFKIHRTAWKKGPERLIGPEDQGPVKREWLGVVPMES